MIRVFSLHLTLAITFLTLLIPQQLLAQNSLSLSIGSFDLTRPNKSPSLQIEYLGLKTKFTSLKISPYAGLQITRAGTIWIGGGLTREIEITKNWHLTPSLGIGYYNKGNSNLDLGHPIEFKSQLTASYQFKNNHKIGLTFSHLSNAGLGNSNPGAEIIAVNYSIPLTP